MRHELYFLNHLLEIVTYDKLFLRNFKIILKNVLLNICWILNYSIFLFIIYIILVKCKTFMRMCMNTMN